MHQSTTPSLSQTIWPRWASRQFLPLPVVQTLLPVTLAYSLSSETVVMRQLRKWKRLWQRSLTCSHKRTSMEPSRSCWNSTTSALQPEEITSKGTRVSCAYYQLKCPYEKSLETYLMILVYIYIYIYIIEKLSRPSFGYYEFISAGHSIRKTNLFRWPSHNREKKKFIKNCRNILSADSYLFKKYYFIMFI